MIDAVAHPRIGLLTRGDRASGQVTARAQERLAPLVDAFARLRVAVEHVIYDDEHVAEVRAQVLALDAVLIWVNPIQDGRDRSRLDALLREVAEEGVWVSAHPDVITRMGTKDVLYATRNVGWGEDIERYDNANDLAERFPARLVERGALVLKQARGTGGEGVWKVQLERSEEPARASAARVRVQHASARANDAQYVSLTDFLDGCACYVAGDGFLVDQPFQERLGDGMIRAYFVQDHLVGFQHQWPTALLATERVETPARRGMEGPDTPAYRHLRKQLDSWIPSMQDVLRLDRDALPVIWDADFLYGPQTPYGTDTYILCEINVSCVWPFPERAADLIARTVLTHT
ncbi:Cj0069 family protein [Microbacterium sp. MRS-1]|uniref:Cj0069 family protein n=1 Tax=Microbacterium sp. MRS-1 TaxID=1451261 RepID=UPI000445F207|nr:Cj0069 family protein [Microbacterium sp. MRS-1]EXJ51809.1 hypothetical protein AS96_07675 [Microbacterium sp. MRS-1]MBN9151218.1 Cj0069 family protein [Micrococcales bacterium]